jgi:hypothetical protein
VRDFSHSAVRLFMFIEKFYQCSNNKVSFTRQQASDFAKKMADDFNPLHDITAKRFCVPGDLLFATVLSTSGLNQKMKFTFSGMVTDDNELNFPKKINEFSSITDDKEKEYLNITASGEHTNDEAVISSLIKAYVGFSGQTFPLLLGELMAKNDVMINPSRPMVMYESMSIDLNRLDVGDITLKLAKSCLAVNGKRGEADLEFDLYADGEVIGHGKKHMLLSSLRSYCPEAMQELSERYNGFKTSYTG